MKKKKKIKKTYENELRPSNINKEDNKDLITKFKDKCKEIENQMKKMEQNEKAIIDNAFAKNALEIVRGELERIKKSVKQRNYAVLEVDLNDLKSCEHCLYILVENTMVEGYNLVGEQYLIYKNLYEIVKAKKSNGKRNKFIEWNIEGEKEEIEKLKTSKGVTDEAKLEKFKEYFELYAKLNEQIPDLEKDIKLGKLKVNIEEENKNVKADFNKNYKIALDKNYQIKKKK